MAQMISVCLHPIWLDRLMFVLLFDELNYKCPLECRVEIEFSFIHHKDSEVCFFFFFSSDTRLKYSTLYFFSSTGTAEFSVTAPFVTTLSDVPEASESFCEKSDFLVIISVDLSCSKIFIFKGGSLQQSIL